MSGLAAGTDGVAPRLVLHVGAYKTATSTVQSLFSLHEAEIAASFGIHYPRTFRRVNSGLIIAGHPRASSFAHHMIAHLLRREADGPDGVLREFRGLARLFREMEDEFRASGASSLFLSSELLSFISRADKEFVLKQLAAFDVRVVYAVRNPVDYVESMTNQALKSGERVRLAARREGLEPIQFLRNIEDWTDLLGPDRVQVLPFASAYFEPFCQAFLAAFEDPAFADWAAPRMPGTNASISAEGARVRLMLNAHLPRSRDMDRKRRHAVTQMLTDLDAKLARRTPLVFLDTAERRAIQETNRPQIDTICDRYLPRETWARVAAPERGLSARRTQLDDVTFSAQDLDQIAACLVRARALFAEPAGDA